jgi:hypothetical protein
MPWRQPILGHSTARLILLSFGPSRSHMEDGFWPGAERFPHDPALLSLEIIKVISRDLTTIFRRDLFASTRLRERVSITGMIYTHPHGNKILDDIREGCGDADNDGNTRAVRCNS